MPLCWGMDPFTVVAMNASTMFAICKMRSCASLELGQKRLSADKGPSPDEGSTVDGSMSELLESPLRCTCHEIFEGQASTWGLRSECSVIMRLGNSASQVGANMDYKRLLGMVTQLQARLEKPPMTRKLPRRPRRSLRIDQSRHP